MFRDSDGIDYGTGPGAPGNKPAARTTLLLASDYIKLEFGLGAKPDDLHT